ncbi:hypothetical protein ACVW1C_008525, partial [Bradyrhizobium sp. USDA 4011]
MHKLKARRRDARDDVFLQSSFKFFFTQLSIVCDERRVDSLRRSEQKVFLGDWL